MPKFIYQGEESIIMHISLTPNNNPKSPSPLLLLRTTPPALLRSLHALLISLDRATLHSPHNTRILLPWSLQLSTSRIAEHVDLDQISLESALDGNDGLDEQGVGVFEIEVHDAHHSDAHELGAHELAELVGVVFLDGGGHRLGLFGGTHGWGLDVLDDGLVCIFC
jgi:hypothetical protein